jgi:ABC-2 type transport system permease protein
VTKNQVVAFILGITGCIVFLVIGLPQSQEVVGNLLGGYPEQVVASLSVMDRFDALTRGLVELHSLLFFAVFTLAWLVMGMFVLNQTKAS